MDNGTKLVFEDVFAPLDILRGIKVNHKRVYTTTPMGNFPHWNHFYRPVAPIVVNYFCEEQHLSSFIAICIELFQLHLAHREIN